MLDIHDREDFAGNDLSDPEKGSSGSTEMARPVAHRCRSLIGRMESVGAEACRVLREGELMERQPMWGVLEKVVIGDPETGNREIAILKSSGRRPSFEREYGCEARAEHSAFLVDDEFEFGVVPPTVQREIDGIRASVQLWIPQATPVGRNTERQLPAVSRPSDSGVVIP